MGKADEDAINSAAARIATGQAQALLSPEEQQAKKQQEILEQQIEDLKNNREPAINPYAGMTNEMANLGVATQAAEFQAEQTDIALANSLDAMRASGAGAGGATALAQAALQSKRSISASLQQQEAANQKAAAQGAQNLAKLQAEGEKFRFGIEETRLNQDLDRTSAQLQQSYQAMSDYQNAIAQAEIQGALGGV
tara:strand:+ start:1887 stop:2471 length:585 start_codon:yes stop_codon:yes gene_type:complete